MAFSIVDEQVVSDHQRQWAGRTGTKGPEGAKAPDQVNRPTAELV